MPGCWTFDDGQKTLPVPEKPQRVLGVDQGLGNLMTCAGNFGAVPLVVRGGCVKAINQQFNKRMADLTSAAMRGHDPKTYRCPYTKQMAALSWKRDNQLRDFFYKAAHAVCRYAAAHGVDVIVFGHNIGQKQDADMGHQTNQAFVSVPHEKLVRILQYVAAGYGIPVVVREESYTSKASLLDGDAIPTQRAGEEKPYTFSGKRVKRGLYRSKDGTCLNADVNGAANIARKEYPDAFKGTDFSAFQSTRTVTFRSLYPDAKGRPAPSKPAAGRLPNHKSENAYRRHKSRDRRRTELKQAFPPPRPKAVKKQPDESAA